MSIEEYLGSWTKVMDVNMLKNTLNNVSKVCSPNLICPNPTEVLKAFKLCPFEKVRVVMVLMDPYPQKDVATGIALGNKADTVFLSPSLEVVKDALEYDELPINTNNFDCTLESWEKQGVLMLNSALTVEMNKIGSHVNIWRPFIADFLYRLSSNTIGIIYCLFGNQAQSFEPYLVKSANHILREYHPSYYARNFQNMPNTIFKQIDDLLIGINGETIKWLN